MRIIKTNIGDKTKSEVIYDLYKMCYNSNQKKSDIINKDILTNAYEQYHFLCENGIIEEYDEFYAEDLKMYNSDVIMDTTGIYFHHDKAGKETKYVAVYVNDEGKTLFLYKSKNGLYDHELVESKIFFKLLKDYPDNVDIENCIFDSVEDTREHLKSYRLSRDLNDGYGVIGSDLKITKILIPYKLLKVDLLKEKKDGDNNE